MTTMIGEALNKVSTAPFRRAEPANKGSITVDADGAEVKDVRVEVPIADDWGPVFSLFKLNADIFEVVDDTVKMNTWQQSKATDDGERDIIQLYSYSARFRRRPENVLTPTDIERLRADLRDWKPPRRRRTRLDDSAPCTAIVNLSDIQGGKAEGGGVKATQQRLLDGLDNTQHWLEEVRKRRNVTEIFLVNNGDPTEGCDGSYATQLFSVELDLRGQMNFVLDNWSLWARTLFPQFEHARFVSVLCNHGTFSRLGGNKNRTTDADNAGGFLAETLQRILSDRREFSHVQWTIPDDEMSVFAESIGGVKLGFNHGHTIPGKDATGFEKWLNSQVRGDVDAHAAQVWVTAHRHHFQAFDLGSCSVFQCPSLDGGSKWLRDLTGKYAQSGVLAFLANPASPVAWSDAAFL